MSSHFCIHVFSIHIIQYSENGKCHLVPLMTQLEYIEDSKLAIDSHMISGVQYSLAIFTLSLFYLLVVPTPHLLSLFLARQSSPWKSQIAHLDMHHLVFGTNFQMHSVRLTSLVSIHFLIHLSVHLSRHPCSHHPSLVHSRLKTFRPPLQAQNFQTTPGLKLHCMPLITNPSQLSLDFFYLLDCFHDNGTGLDLSRSSVYFLVSRFIIIFLFIPCGRHSWLLVSFLLHVKYSLSCRIVSWSQVA